MWNGEHPCHISPRSWMVHTGTQHIQRNNDTCETTTNSIIPATKSTDLALCSFALVSSPHALYVSRLPTALPVFSCAPSLFPSLASSWHTFSIPAADVWTRRYQLLSYKSRRLLCRLMPCRQQPGKYITRALLQVYHHTPCLSPLILSRRVFTVPDQSLASIYRYNHPQARR